MPKHTVQLNATGRTRIDGVIKGEINGTFIGVANGFVDGTVNVNLISGNSSAKEDVDKLIAEEEGKEAPPPNEDDDTEKENNEEGKANEEQ